MVLAVISTAGDSATSCQPEAVSPANVASASNVPAADHRWPTCAPVFWVPLWKRMAVTNPLTSDRNFTPVSIGCPSVTAAFAGTALGGQIVHGQLAVCAKARWATEAVIAEQGDADTEKWIRHGVQPARTSTDGN